jgi:hypothetical protein
MLEGEHLYDQDMVEDQIAILFIYMPIIRSVVFKFAEIWNNHKIRPQKQRPNSVAGIPWMLYEHPPEGVTDYGRQPNPELLASMQKDVADFGMSPILAIYAE